MTPKRPRPACPYCGRHIATTQDGKPYRHRMASPTRILRGPDAGRFQPWCPGQETTDP